MHARPLLAAKTSPGLRNFMFALSATITANPTCLQAFAARPHFLVSSIAVPAIIKHLFRAFQNRTALTNSCGAHTTSHPNSPVTKYAAARPTTRLCKFTTGQCCSPRTRRRARAQQPRHASAATHHSRPGAPAKHQHRPIRANGRVRGRGHGATRLHVSGRPASKAASDVGQALRLDVSGPAPLRRLAMR